MCATFGTFDSLTSISVPPVSGHWSDDPSKKVSLFLVWSSPVGLTQFFTFKGLFPRPASREVHHLHSKLSFERWLTLGRTWWRTWLSTKFLIRPISFHAGYSGLLVKVKSIISPVKSSTDNRLLRGVIREGCLEVAWDTVISPRLLTGLRILCNQIYLGQLSPVPGRHNW